MRYPERRPFLRRAVLALAVLAAMSGSASAHRLKVFATSIGESIEGEAYFVGSGPAAGVSVTLRDSADKILKQGETGPDGHFALPASGTGDIIVVVDAQDGHIARFTVAGTELTPAAGAAPASTPAPAAGAAASSVPGAAPAAPLADIELVVARKIAPLATQLDELQSTLRLQDILGGIGYIVGIFGLVAFLKSRRPAKGSGP